MAQLPIERATHVKETIGTLRGELGTRPLDSLVAEPLELAGFKYLLLVISEAAGKLPAEWKQSYGPDIDWRRIADLGNILRHAYDSVNVETLWQIFHEDLDPLEAAIDAMIAANPPPPARS
jgi:uncharacterized protein with HEPN domain